MDFKKTTNKRYSMYFDKCSPLLLYTVFSMSMQPRLAGKWLNVNPTNTRSWLTETRTL